MSNVSGEISIKPSMMDSIKRVSQKSSILISHHLKKTPFWSFFDFDIEMDLQKKKYFDTLLLYILIFLLWMHQ